MARRRHKGWETNGGRIDSVALIKRSLLPEDIAHAVVFLASPQAEKFITGQAINVDGGAVLADRDPR